MPAAISILRNGEKIEMSTAYQPQTDHYKLYYSSSPAGSYTLVQTVPNSRDSETPKVVFFSLLRSDAGFTASQPFYLKLTVVDGGVEEPLVNAPVASVPPVSAANYDGFSERSWSEPRQMLGYDYSADIWRRLSAASTGALEVSVTSFSGFGLATEAKQDDIITELQTSGATLTSIDGKVATETTLASADATLTSIDGKVATETTLAAAGATLTSIDGKVATETTLASADATLTSIDGKVATETTLASADATLTSIDGKVATEAKQDDIIAELQSLGSNTTDAATETTLSAINTKTPVQGQTTMANSSPVAIASDQSTLSFALDQTTPSASPFSRLRIAEALLLEDVSFLYNKRPLKVSEFTATGGTATHNLADSTVSLTLTNTSGSRALLQTKRYLRYEPGKGILAVVTAVMGTPRVGTSAQIGFFDDADGIFFQQTGTGYNIVRRSSSSGVLVDTAVPQASWNLDTMDGNGPSGITLDFTMAQILVIDLQWLGVGRVRVGFDVDGQLFYVHEFLHANNSTTTYMKRASLPVRWEVVNTAATTGSYSMKAICTAVISEGGVSNLGFPRSINMGITGRSSLATVTPGTPILSIRLKSAYNRAFADPSLYQIVTDRTTDLLVQVILNGTLTAPAWTDAGANSILEYDTSATAITGGETIASFYVTTSGSESLDARPILDRFVLSSDYAGTADTLSLCVVRLAGNAGTTVWGIIEALEVV